MISVALHQRRQKSLRRSLRFRVVQAQAREIRQPRYSRQSRCLQSIRRSPYTSQLAYLRNAHSGAHVVNSAMITFSPFAAARSIMRVVVGPVKLPRSHLNRAPQKPVAKRVHPHARGRRVVARPVLRRRIRLAKIHRAVWKHRPHRNFLRRGRPPARTASPPLDPRQSRRAPHRGRRTHQRRRPHKLPPRNLQIFLHNSFSQPQGRLAVIHFTASSSVSVRAVGYSPTAPDPQFVCRAVERVDLLRLLHGASTSSAWRRGPAAAALPVPAAARSSPSKSW